ncbi:MAG: hypothetical protein AB7I50_13725 [Vicinamibacterales bacterium]
MDDRLARIEDELHAIERQVLDFEHRLATLEARPQSPRSQADEAGVDVAADAARPATAAAITDLVTVLSLAGRSLIVLGGAYLLRAITEAGALPPRAGSLSALGYATLWVFAADRAARRGRPLDATFHGLVSSLVAYPLIYEATVRFEYFTAALSAVALAALGALALWVAWRRSHQVLAWVTTVSMLVVIAALAPATQTPLPYAWCLVLLGVATLWLGYVKDWTALRWPAAVAVDLIGAGLVARAVVTPPRDPPAAVVLLLLAMLAAYLASTAIRTLVRRRNVIPFEVVQTAAVLAVGLGGIMWILQAAAVSTLGFGIVVAAMGASCYAVAFAFVGRLQHREKNFYFYTSVALVFTLVGAYLLFGSRGLPWAATVLGCVSAWLGVRRGRFALSLHGAIYLVVAAAASQLIRLAGSAMWGETASASLPLSVVIVFVAAALMFAAGLPRPLRPDAGERLLHVPRTVVLVTLVWGASGILVVAIAAALSAGRDAGAVMAHVPAIRTVVLSFGALVLGILAGRTHLTEARWLVYPVLLVTGMKILLVDLQAAPAASLVAALGTYGAALIVAPRWLKRQTVAM